jgi:hypothetical protein
MFSLIGFFQEQGYGISPSIYRCSMRERMRSEGLSDESEVCRYIDSGYVVMDVMDAELDVISGDVHIGGASSLLTDGIWIWRKDLSYYTKRYHLDVSGEFLNHARGFGYKIQEVSRERLMEAESYILENLIDSH